MFNINLIILLSLINISFFIFFNKLNKLINIYDLPNNRKIHTKPVSSNGGFYLIINLCALLLFYKNIYIDSKNLFLNLPNFYSFYLTTLLIFIMGVIDDIVDLRPLKKSIYLFILIYSALLIDESLVIEELHFSFIDKIFYLKQASIFFTLFCIFIFINAFNMFDGTNLQAGFYSLIITIFFILHSGYLNIFLPILTFLIFFIYHNSFGKIFLGNSGSHTLGFIFSWFFIKLYNINIIPNIDDIILIMLIPGLDLIRLFYSRTIKKSDFFISDKNHIHHILMNKFNGIKLQLIIVLLVLIPLIIFNYSQMFFISLIIGISNYTILVLFCKKKLTF